MSSDAFKNALINTRTNLSHYYNLSVKTRCNQTTNSSCFKVLETPGHSKLSVCFLYKNILFGGDTNINKEYLFLKLPGSSKINFKELVDKIKKRITKNTIVLPGHGNLF